MHRFALEPILDALPEAVVIADLRGMVIYANSGVVRLFGTQAGDLIERPLVERYPQELWPGLAREIRRVARGADSCRIIDFPRGHDQTVRIEARLQRLCDRTGKPAGILEISREVSSKPPDVVEIQRVRDMLHAITEGSPDAVFVKDLDGRYLLFNSAAGRYVGRAPEEVIGHDDTELFGEADARLLRERDRRVIESGQLETEEEVLTAAGVTRIYLATKAPYRDRNGRILGTIGISRDITARRRAEEALLLRDRAIQAVTQGIIIADACRPDHPVIYASPGFTRMTGYTAQEIVGRNPRFLQGGGTDPEAVATMREALRQARPCTVELLNYRKDETAFWNEVSISPVTDSSGMVTHFVGVMTDVTNRRILEEQFRHAQKVEALGQLAGGVAHDFNNLLTVISGYSEILLETLAEDDPLYIPVQEIKQAGDRSAALTRQLLAFSRKQAQSARILDLNDIIRDAERMLRRLLGEDVRLSTQLAPQSKLIKADPGQLEQVLMNMAVNSRDAMPLGGELSVETHLVVFDQAEAEAHGGLTAGTFMLLKVRDTGSGMSEETQRHMFDPFFSTKEPGKGTGLGLSVVHGIVKQHGGHISVVSEPGRGTTFSIYLPTVEAATPTSLLAFAGGTIPRGVERILLVEDEPTVRILAEQALTNCGYEVVSTADPLEAIQISRRLEGIIHLLLTDVVMPGLHGRQLADLLQAERPEMKVLFTSGYTDEAVSRGGVSPDHVSFLQKPFSISSLAEKVRAVLDASSESGGSHAASTAVGWLETPLSTVAVVPPLAAFQAGS